MFVAYHTGGGLYYRGDEEGGDWGRIGRHTSEFSSVGRAVEAASQHIPASFSEGTIVVERNYVKKSN